MSGRRMTGAIFAVRQLMKNIGRNIKYYIIIMMVFSDLQTVPDTVPCQEVLTYTRETEVSEKCARRVQDMYDEARTHV